MPDIVTSKVFVDGEKGITATKMNQIISGAVIQPAFYSAKPSSATLDPTDVLLELKGTGAYAQISGAQVASSVAGQLTLADATQNGMLRQVSGLTTDVVDGTNHCVPIASMAGITQMRLRSFNSIGNSTFEVDQRSVGATLASPVTGTLVQDRWLYQKAGTFVASHAQGVAAANEVLIPATNFAISRNFHRITITTAQASLGASDNLTLVTQLEGPRFRELQYDVHSVSLLVRSSVAGLTFGLGIRDPGATTKSLLKLCTIPSANTWALIPLPNLPVFPAGNFSSAPGVLGYLLSICLAAGTTLTAVANDVWQNGNFIGALGQANLAATLNATFDVAFVQHEPGSVCTTPIDCPFTQNHDECLRYYQKTYDYAVALGAGVATGAVYYLHPTASVNLFAHVPFKKPFAKTPTVLTYSPTTGGSAVVDDVTNNARRAVSAYIGVGQNSFGGVTMTTNAAAAAQYQFHYTTDTGW